MLIREWKCTCPTDTVKEFISYLNETGVKDTLSIDGCCGYKIMQRELSPEIEITFITFWETFEQMKVYTGDNLYKAVLYPEDYLYKITSETEVKIFEIVAEGTATSPFKVVLIHAQHTVYTVYTNAYAYKVFMLPASTGTSKGQNIGVSERAEITFNMQYQYDILL